MTSIPKNSVLAGLAAVAVVLAPGSVAESAGSAATHLTRASAAALIARDAKAATVIAGGDQVRVSGCRAVGRGAWRCQVELIPAQSMSRCRFAVTVRLVRHKPSFAYGHANCTN